MGLDALIYVRTRGGHNPTLCDSLPPGFVIQPSDGYGPSTATHEVKQGLRYYAPGYERGPWPVLCAALMALMAGQNVEAVWYGSDCEDTPTEITAGKINLISAHYMEHGDRPYRGTRPTNTGEQA